jgi:hypothetical protein
MSDLLQVLLRPHEILLIDQIAPTIGFGAARRKSPQEPTRGAYCPARAAQHFDVDLCRFAKG